MKEKTLVDELILQHNKMYGLNTQINNCDMFFDETNNIRIAKLTDKGTNDEIKHRFFVLGGVAVEKGVCINIDDVYDYIGLQSSTREMKFKHLCPYRNNFTNIIKSKKLLSFFKFLDTKSIYIHFHAFHFLYWTLVDIIDSLFDKKDHLQDLFFIYHEKLKSDFMEVLLNDYDNLIKMLYDYSFPNIPKEKVNDFTKDVYKLYLENLDYYDLTLYENFSKELLRQMIKSKLKKTELIFLQDNQDYLICGELDSVYVQSMVTFKNEKKYYDEELYIQERIREKDSNYEKKLNCNWVNSKDNIYIQMSDCVCGFIAQIYKFASECEPDEIYNFVEKIELDSVEFQVLYIFNNLFEKSEKYSKFFVCKTIPEYIQCKFLYLLDLIKNKI